jgi:hypothetical protein
VDASRDVGLTGVHDELFVNPDAFGMRPHYQFPPKLAALPYIFTSELRRIDVAGEL